MRVRWPPSCGPLVSRSNHAWPSDHEHSPAAGRGHSQSITIRCCAAPEAGSRWGTLGPIVWPTAIRRRPLADRGSPGRTHGKAVANPRITVCSTVVLTALSPAPRNRSILPDPFVQRDRTPASNILANKHQSSCATPGCRAACSPPTPTSSVIAAKPGTSSWISPGAS